MDKPLPTSLECKNVSVTYRWSAVAITEDMTHDAVIFGVVSNRYESGAHNIFAVDAFGISMKDQLVCDGNDVFLKYDSEYTPFKPNEIICMEYEISNGNKCTLSFYNESKHNEFIWKINLPNEIAGREVTNWYPVFSKTDSGLIKVVPCQTNYKDAKQLQMI